MNRSVIIAAAIAAALVLYFVIGTLTAASNSPDLKESTEQDTTSAIPKALFTTLRAQSHPVIVNIKGQTAPDKVVTVKSATVGSVVATPAREGSFVQKGTILCGLEVDARQANVKQAEAQRAAAQIEFDAAKALAAKGLAPANREAAAKAALDAAEAAVSSAKIELSRTQIRAPFDGIFETRMAEAGDFLSPGSPCGVLVDLSPVLVTAQITEDQAGWIEAGRSATASLANGQTFPATIRYVARTADARTRTFTIEAAIDTGQSPVAAGVTADLTIPLAETDAIKLSPALLTLADNGDVGVRLIDDSNTIEFREVTIIDDALDGIWVTGLSTEVRVVSEGQEFLSTGLKVEPIVHARGSE